MAFALRTCHKYLLIDVSIFSVNLDDNLCSVRGKHCWAAHFSHVETEAQRDKKLARLGESGL